MKKLVIIGSSRNDGNTRKVIEKLNSLADFDILDLSNFQINQYDYNHGNHDDDFLDLIKKIVNYDTLIFATPVYWYSMSGIMKVFFDRITDLLDKEKELGRKLRKKNMAVLTSSNGDHLGESFWLPFINTAQYLGMNYIAGMHTVENEDPTDTLEKFAASLEKHQGMQKE